MALYAAFLRGVMPTAVTMPQLVAAFEAAGFADVRTVLGSGNVLFTARAAGDAALARRADAAMLAELGRVFPAAVRPVEALEALVARDPFAGVRLAAGTKRIVSFLRAPPAPAPRLPLEEDGARVLRLEGLEAFTVYAPSPRGPVFMKLIERALGKDVTTRTWETVQKVLKAAASTGGPGSPR